MHLSVLVRPNHLSRNQSKIWYWLVHSKLCSDNFNTNLKLVKPLTVKCAKMERANCASIIILKRCTLVHSCPNQKPIIGLTICLPTNHNCSFLDTQSSVRRWTWCQVSLLPANCLWLILCHLLGVLSNALESSDTVFCNRKRFSICRCRLNRARSNSLKVIRMTSPISTPNRVPTKKAEPTNSSLIHFAL